MRGPVRQLLNPPPKTGVQRKRKKKKIRIWNAAEQ